MKKSGGDRLKYAINGSTLSTAARSPFPDGEGKEEAASPQKESQPRLAALGSPFQGKGLARTHPPSSERRGNSAFPVSSFRAKARNLFRSQSNRRCEDSGIPDTKPSSRGEGAPKGRIGQERYEKERGSRHLHSYALFEQSFHLSSRDKRSVSDSSDIKEKNLCI